MAGRRFTDRDGARWEIRVRSKREWEFEPVENNTGAHRYGEPPGYEADPFEMSIEELQRVLDAAPAPKKSTAKNPFLD